MNATPTLFTLNPVFECSTKYSSSDHTDPDSTTSTVCPAVPTGNTGAGEVGDSSTAIEAALAGVAAGLLLALMGVDLSKKQIERFYSSPKVCGALHMYKIRTW